MSFRIQAGGFLMNEITSRNSSWDAFLQFGERKSVPKNTVIYFQGEVAQGIYFVEKGLIKAKSNTILGDEKNINFVGPGQMFGELSLIQEPSISTTVSVEDSVIYFYSVEWFKQLLHKSDEPLMFIFNSILKKICVLVEQTALSTAEQQVAHALLHLSDSSKNEKINVKQKDLAELSGLTRITVNKVLKTWKENGIIDSHNKSIHLKNKAVLSTFAKQIIE
jgi:CRP-like cAMP-binding protein